MNTSSLRLAVLTLLALLAMSLRAQAAVVTATFNSATDVPITAASYTATGDSVSFTLGFTPTAGTSLTVVQNTGLAFINGTFSNLAQGQTVTLNYNQVNYDFVATYFGGTGNDLVLLWKSSRVFAWGQNTYGQLGDVSITPRTLPTAVSTASGTSALFGKTVIALASGTSHTLALLSDGTVASWGRNNLGQLGDNTITDRTAPVLVNTASGTSALFGKTVIALAVGDAHNLALCSDGTVVAWGFNGLGQLGDNSTTARTVPTAVNTASGISALFGKTVVGVAAGLYASYVVCSDGTAVAWGNNTNGQLGINSTTQRNLPTAVNTTSGTSALFNKTVVSIAAGTSHALALCSDGTLTAWGNNLNGGLGDNSTTQRLVPVLVNTASGTSALFGKTVVAIAAANYRSHALCSDGTVASWGANNLGQLGDNTLSQRLVPTAVNAVSGISALFGKSVAAIATGEAHSLALCSDGTLTAWGSNASGQFGNNTATSSSAPTLVSTSTISSTERFSKLFAGSAASHSLALVAAPPALPVVNSPTITSVTGSSATLGGTVVSNGGLTLTARGVVYAKTSDNANPQIGGTGVTVVNDASTTTGSFTAAITGLDPATSYSFAAFATNAAGTSYASQSFGTAQGDVTATYTAATDVPLSLPSFTLTGGTATLSLGYAPTAGTELMVARSTGPAFISGTFSNLTQGQTLTLSYGGLIYDFVVNYYGGTGNDLTLVWKSNRALAWGGNSFSQLGDGTATQRNVPTAVTASGVLAGKTIVALTEGAGHALALCSDGTLAAWGYNTYGQLGDNTTTLRSVPVLVNTASGVSALFGKRVVGIAAGYYHSLAVCSDGTVAAWGYNANGQVGDNSLSNRSVPVAVNTASGVSALFGKSVVSVAAGNSHSAALCSDGSVVAWGWNNVGQVGDNTTTDRSVPTAVSTTLGLSALASRTVLSIAVGDRHSMALCSDGSVVTWGGNSNGQLGNNTTTARSVPVVVNTASGVSALFGKTVVAVAVAGNHSVALCSDGAAVAWGLNSSGQLGDNSFTQRPAPVAVNAVSGTSALFGKSVVSVVAGASHTLAVCSDGTATAWGLNNSGQLGDNTTTQRSVPVVVNSSSLVAGERFTRAFGGANTASSLALVATPSQPPTLTTTTVAGVTSTTATLGATVTSDGGQPLSARGVVYAKTSQNANPQIGGANVTVVNDAANTTGVFAETITGLDPATSYSFTAFATNALGTTYTSVTLFASAVPDLSFAYTAATDVPMSLPVVTLASGTATITLGYAPTTGTELMVVRSTGPAFISGTFSNLAQGQTLTLNYGGVNYDFVVNYYGGSGNDLTLVWKSNRVVGWGSNSLGELGDNTTTNRSVPTPVTSTGVLAGKTVVALAQGANYSLALCSDGTLAAWGRNNFGQLGDNTTTNRSVPVLVNTTTGVSALFGKRVVGIAAGYYHSLAVCSDGTVAAWGFNGNGQLGDNTTTQRLVPVAVNAASAVSALFGKSVVSVGAGSAQSFALCSDGSMVAWGYNNNGQLGDNTVIDRPVPVAVNTTPGTSALAGKSVVSFVVGNYHNMALCSDGSVVAWGYNSNGQIGDNSTTNRLVPVAVNTASGTSALFGKVVTGLAVGSTHSLALCSDGTTVAWGYNGSGPLGDNSVTQRLVPVAVNTTSGTSALFGKSVIGLAAGSLHSLAVCSDGTSAGWGTNSSGQVGDNTTTQRNAPVAVNSSTLAAGERFTRVCSGSTASLSSLALVATPPQPPTVAAASVASVTSSTATLGGTVTSDSGQTLTARGVVYAKTSQNANPQIGGANVTVVNDAANTTGVFTEAITGLDPATSYSFKAFATSGIGTSYTSAVVFYTTVSDLSYTFTAATDVPVSLPNVIFTGGTATLALGYAPTPGTELTVARNTSLAFSTGTFSNLTQGQTVTLSYAGLNYDFVVNYFGGSGNDLTLVWKSNRAFGWGNNFNGQLGDSTTTRRTVPTAVTSTGVLSGKTILALAEGESHALALCSDGTLAAWGINTYGQLGDNTTTQRTVPVLVNTDSGVSALFGKRVVAIAAGTNHSLALCSDGTVATWGYNSNGQLGDATYTQRNVPVAVNSDSGISALFGRSAVAIAGGLGHSLALCSDGTVLAWGQNTSGQLGDTSTINSSVPVVVNAASGFSSLFGKSVIGITAGQNFSLALCSDGTVSAWGDNTNGQLGDASTTQRLAPVAVNRVSGTSALFGKNVTAISAGSNHSLALCSDGTVAAWGNNSTGQLGDNTTTPTQRTAPVLVNTTSGTSALAGKVVVSIAAGSYLSLAVCADGTAAAWGINTSNQLGDGTATSQRIAPVLVSSSNLVTGERFTKVSAFPASSSSLGISSLPLLAPTLAAASVTNVMPSTVSLGATVTSDAGQPLTARGVVYAKTSQNANPQIGGANVTVVYDSANTTGSFSEAITGLDPATSYTFSAFATSLIGTSYTSALGFGSAVPDLTATFTTPTDVPVSLPSLTFSGGTATLTLGYAPTPGTELIVARNTGLAFSSGAFSNLAQGQTVTLNYAGQNFDFVVNYFGGSGNDLSLLWKNNRALAWGNNANGQLGDSTTTQRNVPTPVTSSGVLAGKTVVTLAEGSYHTLALCSDGTLAAWGYNSAGQLGDNTTTQRTQPVLVNTASGVSALFGKRVVGIAAGYFHSLAVCSDGTVAAWGYNTVGQLGDNTTINRSVPVAVNTATGVSVLSGKSVVSVAAGAYFTLALCSDSTVVAWGQNNSGQLGDGTTTQRLVPVAVNTSVGTASALFGKSVSAISAGYDHGLALCSDGTVAAWGLNTSGQLGDNTTTQRFVPVAVNTASGTSTLFNKVVVGIAGGNAHSMALCSDGTVATWGNNSNGQLGDNSTTNRLVPVAVNTASGTSALFGKTVVGMAAGAGHSLALCSDGTAAAWGTGGSGQLGNNTLTQRNAPFAVTNNLASGERLSRVVSGGLAAQSFAIANAVANSAPTDIALSAGSIAENNAANATLGTLSTTDPDPGNTFAYTLASGGADNASFTIAGNALKLTPSADFETKSSYAIKIRSTDQGGLFFEKDFTISITDVTLPQTITFGALSTKTFGDAPFTVSATGGASGQPVTFTASGPATISGSTVTLTGTGTVTITAHQAGSGDYSAASDVSQSFTVQSAFVAWATTNGLPTDPGADGGVNLQRFAFGLSPTSGNNPVVLNGSGDLVSDGFPTVHTVKSPTSFAYNALFTRPKNWASLGLTYTIQFSGDLTTWITSTATPTPIATDADSEAVIVRYPFFVNGKKAQFFQVVVNTVP